LVLSTLHTNDAPSAVARLIDLGVEPFLVCSSLSAVLAQRLVRMIHAPCAGRGCAECLGTGFRGRTGVFELLVVDEAIRREIQARGSGAAIKAAAVQGGMVTLMAAGVHLVEQGLTTSGEVGRVIQGME
jgi:general secretion pathway protein E